MNRFLQKIAGNQCLLVSAVILATMILAPLFAHNASVLHFLNLIYLGVILVSPTIVSNNRIIFRISIVAGIFLLPSHIFFLLPIDPTNLFGSAQITLQVVTLFFELLLVGCVTRYSLLPDSRREPISGCVLTYLLLGISFGNVFYLIQQYIPGSFVTGDGNEVLTRDALHYYSFITLSTCGFGDIVPRLPFARMVTSLETICGVLYIALFVGRIIRIPSTFSFTEKLSTVPGEDNDGKRTFSIKAIAKLEPFISLIHPPKK